MTYVLLIILNVILIMIVTVILFLLTNDGEKTMRTVIIFLLSICKRLALYPPVQFLQWPHAIH